MDNQSQPEYQGSEHRDSNLQQLQESYRQHTIHDEVEERRESQSDMLSEHVQHLEEHEQPSNEHVQHFEEHEQPSNEHQVVHDYHEGHHADQKQEVTPINSNYVQLPLKAAKVLFPQLKESMVNSYMVYKVNFIWNDKEFEVARRYSDFKELRKAIKNFLPFTFVFPMHKKQMMVG